MTRGISVGILFPLLLNSAWPRFQTKIQFYEVSLARAVELLEISVP